MYCGIRRNLLSPLCKIQLLKILYAISKAERYLNLKVFYFPSKISTTKGKQKNITVCWIQLYVAFLLGSQGSYCEQSVQFNKMHLLLYFYAYFIFTYSAIISVSKSNSMKFSKGKHWTQAQTGRQVAGEQLTRKDLGLLMMASSA